ncbi:P21-activated kinase 1 [Penicillium alfredii]|uniref:P21-activated kinase 1 n=1 Tax=Penicillium alfredii TaxID=1506179 RepID=A0A9W9ERC2_9EURO|nr:P21-activated kinase 1 [Penicillium alfredii]KAJ5086588.1 P21-activated kinase 1 [Penicillium alfredii]
MGVLHKPGLAILSILLLLTSVIYSAPTESLNQLYARDNLPDAIANWDVWQKYTDYINKHKPKDIRTPDDVPFGNCKPQEGYCNSYVENCEEDRADKVEYHMETKIGYSDGGDIWDGTMTSEGQKANVMISNSTNYPGRILQSAELQRLIKSPRVHGIDDWFYDIHRKTAYQIMPQIPGDMLGVPDTAKELAKDPSKVNQAIIQVLEGVQAIHRTKVNRYAIWHGNLTLYNVLDMGDDQYQLWFFHTATSEPSSTDYWIGKPGHMAPEKVKLQPFGRKVDWWAVMWMWLQLSYYDQLSDETKLLDLWKALVGEGTKLLTPDETRDVLRKKIPDLAKDDDENKDKVNLAAISLCGDPKERASVGEALRKLKALKIATAKRPAN